MSNNKLSLNDRQLNLDILIKRLMNTKKEAISEIQEDFTKPAFQAALKELREKNAKQQSNIGV